MINHPDLGDIVFKKVYFELDKPILFTCGFSNTDDTYVGILVEDFDLPCALDNINVNNYYFVGANNSEIKMMENHQGKIKKLFSTRPVWYLHHRSTEHGSKDKWILEKTIEPTFTPTEELTLC